MPSLQVRKMDAFCSPLTQGRSNQQCKNNLAVTTFEYIKTIGTPLVAYVYEHSAPSAFLKIGLLIIKVMAAF